MTVAPDTLPNGGDTLEIARVLMIVPVPFSNREIPRTGSRTDTAYRPAGGDTGFPTCRLALPGDGCAKSS